MRALLLILKLLLKIAVAPVILMLTVFIWLCVGLVYISGLVLGFISMVFALLGVAVLITYSPQNGIILMILAFLISPFGLPNEAIWMLGKVQDLKYAIQDKEKVLDKMPQYLFLLKLAFSCQICALHLILVLLQAKTKFILVLELEQCCCPKQKINQVAMIKSVVIVEVMGNIHTDYNFLKEISCEL